MKWNRQLYEMGGHAWLPVCHCLLLSLLLFDRFSTAIAARENGQPDQVTSVRDVSQILADLDSPRRAVRAQAEQELIEAGESILEKLPDLQVVPSAAVRDALQRAISQIEMSAARRSLESAPLNLAASPTLVGVFDSLAEASGNRIIIGPLESRLDRLPWQGELPHGTFFEVLDAITMRHGLGWRWSRLGRQIELIPEPERKGTVPVVYDRVFRISHWHSQLQTNFIDPQSRRILQAGLAIDVPPNLIPYWLTVSDQDFSADVTDSRITLFNPGARREIAPFGGRFLFPILLTLPARNSPDEFELKGTVTIRLAARPIPILLRPTQGVGESHRVGHQRITMLKWSTDAAATTIVLDVEFDSPAPELESHRLGMLHRNVEMRASDGRVLRPESMELVSVEGLKHRIAYRFAVVEEEDGSQFVYTAPTLVSDVPVTFALSNIPVPAN